MPNRSAVPFVPLISAGRNDPSVLSAASLLLAELLTGLEKDRDRRTKKLRVIEKKRELLRAAFPAETKDLTLKGDTWALLGDALDREHSLRLVIDLVFSDPLSPWRALPGSPQRWRTSSSSAFLATCSTLDRFRSREAR